MEAVKGTFADIHEAWNIVEGKHDIYMIHSAEDEIEQNEGCINQLQELYAVATTQAQYIHDQPCTSKNKWLDFLYNNALYSCPAVFKKVYSPPTNQPTERHLFR